MPGGNQKETQDFSKKTSWVNIIKTDINEIGYKSVDQIQLTQDVVCQQTFVKMLINLQAP